MQDQDNMKEVLKHLRVHPLSKVDDRTASRLKKGGAALRRGRASRKRLQEAFDEFDEMVEQGRAANG
jgi:hypothetical protein